MAQKYSNVVFFKVDVDEAEDVAAEVGITAMPTFQFYKNGTKVAEFQGANEAKLEETIKKHM
jgi:thioredoxin 1